MRTANLKPSQTITTIKIRKIKTIETIQTHRVYNGNFKVIKDGNLRVKNRIPLNMYET